MVWLILLTALCFAVFTGFVTQQAGKALLDKEVQLLNRIAEGYVNNIEILLDTYRDKVRLVATRTRLRQLLAENNGATSSLERVSTMSKILNDAITGDPEIDLIVITDLANRFITSTDLELLDLSEKQKVTLLGEPTGNITEPAIDTVIPISLPERATTAAQKRQNWRPSWKTACR